jgi:pimeloyl-ACP methyl ester carboxylesterase
MYNDYRFRFAAASVKAVLFLHGMNSSPATWATARSDMGFGALPTISNGSISGTAAGDYRGVLAYAVQFGATDSTSGRKGLESISGGANYSTSGDFETFGALGTEVNDAVTAIVNKNKATYGNVEVVLVGHSRGGLAGRAFLQTATSASAKAVVKGFVTTGSPHTGSRLARFNTWLGSNPRDPKKQSADWDVADFMKNYGSLDVRRPTIGDLSDQSSAISSLASGLGNLPTGIKCVGIQYNGYALGRANLGYNLFDAALYQYGPQVTTACRTYLIGSTGKPGDYMGDGIVPAANQQFPGKTNVSYSTSVLHTEEPQKSSDLKAGLKKAVTWWD